MCSQVYIIGHVPPGFFEKKRSKPWFTPQFNKLYLDLIQKHHSVIVGQFFGHHHTDSFRMFYNSEGTVRLLLLMLFLLLHQQWFLFIYSVFVYFDFKCPDITNYILAPETVVNRGDHLSVSAGSPISTMFLSPGVTPWKTTLPGVTNGANNPGIRIFEYDTQTLRVKVSQGWPVVSLCKNDAFRSLSKQFFVLRMCIVQKKNPMLLLFRILFF